MTFDPDDGLDAGTPVRVGDGVDWIEHDDVAQFLPVSPGIGAAGAIERRRASAELVNLPVQGRLVFLNLDDQADVGLSGGLECFLAVQRVQCHEMAGQPEFGEQGLHGRDLVGTVAEVDMREHQGGVGSQRAQHLSRGAVVEVVEAAAQRLAVESDAGVRSFGMCILQLRRMAAKGIFDRPRVETLEDVADRGVCGSPTP